MAAFWLALTGGVVLHSLYLYLAREPRVPGWSWALGLRLSALAVLGLLALNPLWPPWRSGKAVSTTPLLILDGTQGQALPRTDGRTGWEGALDERARQGLDGLAVALLDSRGLTFPAGSPTTWPTPAPGPRPSLKQSLLEAGEAGYAPLLVASDFRWEDPEAILEEVRQAGIPVRPLPLPGELRNAGIQELRLPPVVIAGATARAQVRLHHEAPRRDGGGGMTADPGGEAGPDTLRLEILLEGEEVATWSQGIGSGWGRQTLELELPPVPDSTVELRYEARVRLAGDVYSGDDVAVAYSEVELREGGVVALSFQPDWELRHLLPALADFTGLPGRGWVLVGNDQWLPLRRGGEEGGGLASSEELREWVESARILVVHGLGAAAPAWLADTWDTPAARLAVGGQGATSQWLEFATEAPAGGEWSILPEIPSSPLAPLLSGLDPRGLPPVSGVLVPAAGEGGARGDAGVWQPVLNIRVAGGEESEPLVLVRQDGEHRDGLILGQGLWRWSAREGSGREAYRTLVSALAGWLAEGRVVPPEGRVSPGKRVSPPFQPVRWEALGRNGEVLTLEMEARAEGTAWTDSVTVTPGDGPEPTGFVTPALPAGSYGYRVEDEAGATVGEGRFDVEGHLQLLANPAAAPGHADGESLDIPTAAAGATPLRARPLPYLLLLTLLCGEWWVRRRSGLR